MKRSKFTVCVLNLAITNATSVPTLMDLQSPAVSGELLSCLNLVLGIVFSAGYNAGPFLSTAVVPEGSCPPHGTGTIGLSPSLILLVCSSLESVLPAPWDGGFHQMKDSQALLTEGSGGSNAMIIFTSVIHYLIFTPLVVLSSLILFITVQKRPLQQGPRKRLDLAIVVTIMAFLIFAVPVRLASTLKHRLPTSLPFRLIYVFASFNITNPSATPWVSSCVRGQRKMRLGEAIQRARQGALKDGTRRAR